MNVVTEESSFASAFDWWEHALRLDTALIELLHWLFLWLLIRDPPHWGWAAGCRRKGAANAHDKCISVSLVFTQLFRPEGEDLLEGVRGHGDGLVYEGVYWFELLEHYILHHLWVKSIGKS